MFSVWGFELEGHPQCFASGFGDRFCKFKQGEMRFARVRKDRPTGVVIGVDRTSHAVPLLAEVGTRPCQFQTTRLALVRGGIQLGLDRRQMKAAVSAVPSWAIMRQRWVRQNLKTQVLNSGGKIAEGKRVDILRWVRTAGQNRVVLQLCQ